MRITSIADRLERSEELIDNPDVDFVLRGDSAEEAVLELFRRLRAGAPLEGVPNLSLAWLRYSRRHFVWKEQERPGAAGAQGTSDRCRPRERRFCRMSEPTGMRRQDV